MRLFRKKKKNTLLHETTGHTVATPLGKETGFLFSRFFSRGKLLGLAFVAALVGGTLVYGLFFSSEFQITSIRVVGASHNDEQAIASLVQNVAHQKILHLIPRYTYFLFPQAEIIFSLQAQFPGLSLIELTHPNPNSIVISVEERTIVGIWCPSASSLQQNSGQAGQAPRGNSEVYPEQSEGCAFFDKDGVIFEQAPDATSGHLLFVLHDARTETMPDLGSHVLESGTYVFVQKLRDALNNAGRIPVSFTIKNDQEIDANFLDGTHAWNVYFSTGYGAAYQVDVLTRLLSQTIGDKNFPYLDYVDLRLENKAYYAVHPAG